MAGSVNKVILMGYLGADPDVRSFQGGGRVANLRVATAEHWKDKQTGERRERTEWHSVAVAVDGLIGIAEKYLRKGSRVYLEGQLRTRKWQDRGGNDRYTTEVLLSGPQAVLTMLDVKDKGGPSTGSGSSGDSSFSGSASSSGGDYPDLDDEVLF